MRGEKAKYHVGDRINGILLVSIIGRRFKDRDAMFQCPYCGNLFKAMVCSVKSGCHKSCGCKQYTGDKFVTHGHTRRGVDSPEYTSWCHMKRRCYVVTDNSYHCYGGRGISVCDRWLNSFENFIADMGKRPSNKHSIDRINNDGNYEPGNCRWATSSQQRRNQRDTVMAEYNGCKKPLATWCEELNLSYSLMWERIKSGKSVKYAFETPTAFKDQTYQLKRKTFFTNN